VACEGPCPCKDASGSGGEAVPATAVGGDVGVCLDIADPVCGIDNKNYTSSCFAFNAGVGVQCKGACPCPDLITALEKGGGMLLVPTDDALLEMMNATSAGDWLSDEALLRQVLARHTILTQNQPVSSALLSSAGCAQSQGSG